MEPADQIWMNGELVEWENAQTHVLSHGLHYGTGIFEGIRAYNTPRGTQIFRLDSHTDRFYDSAKIMGMELEPSKKQFKKAVKKTVRENNLESCYIRPIAYRGYGGLGVNPEGTPVELAIAAWPWGAYLGEDALKNGVEAATSSWSRHHPNVMPTKAKASGNYVNSVLAKQEASERGVKEAIMLTPEGYVAEGSGENIFAVRNGELVTPPKADVLEGITMASVKELASEMGIEVKQEKMTRDQLLRADEAFFCGTAAEITPVREIDGRTISDGRGPVTEKVQSRFMEVARGETSDRKHWRTPIKE